MMAGCADVCVPHFDCHPEQQQQQQQDQYAVWCVTVWLQVTKVSPTATNARIMCCAGQALDADFTGVIRQQDVRAHEVDKVRRTHIMCAGAATLAVRPALCAQQITPSQPAAGCART
jgi:hypothetical protein